MSKGSPRAAGGAELCGRRGPILRRAGRWAAAAGLGLLSWAAAADIDITPLERQLITGGSEAGINLDAEQSYRLGLAYDVGERKAQDFERAQLWYRRAAWLGHSRAKLSLGLMYAEGQGVPRDMAAAVRWIRESAEDGDPDAQFSLGVILSDGAAGPPDPSEAERWYRRAAGEGHTEAMNNLGILLAQGTSRAADLPTAYAWFTVAAELGNAAALSNRDWVLGVMTEAEQARAEEALRAVRRALRPS